MAPARRREQLLDAALELIVERGYAGVSIEAVARSAGVTRPVVYDHFAKLGRLLHTLLEREERIALTQLEQVVPVDPGELSPPELLLRGAQMFLEAVCARPTTWRLILLPIDGTPAIIREHVEMTRAQMQRRIAALVRWAFAHPEFPQGLDVELAARSIMHLAEEAGRMVLTDPERYTPDRYVEFASSVVELLWPPARSQG